MASRQPFPRLAQCCRDVGSQGMDLQQGLDSDFAQRVRLMARWEERDESWHAITGNIGRVVQWFWKRSLLRHVLLYAPLSTDSAVSQLCAGQRRVERAEPQRHESGRQGGLRLFPTSLVLPWWRSTNVVAVVPRRVPIQRHALEGSGVRREYGMLRGLACGHELGGSGDDATGTRGQSGLPDQYYRNPARPNHSTVTGAVWPQIWNSQLVMSFTRNMIRRMQPRGTRLTEENEHGHSALGSRSKPMSSAIVREHCLPVSSLGSWVLGSWNLQKLRHSSTGYHRTSNKALSKSFRGARRKRSVNWNDSWVPCCKFRNSFLE